MRLSVNWPDSEPNVDIMESDACSVNDFRIIEDIVFSTDLVEYPLIDPFQVEAILRVSSAGSCPIRQSHPEPVAPGETLRTDVAPMSLDNQFAQMKS